MNRKVFVMVAVLAATLLLATSVMAQGQLTLDWDSEVNPEQCGPGPLVINVTEKIVNSLDSGVLSWWAFTDYNRLIQVRQTGPTAFCAIVRYQGKFTTAGGPSPAGTDPSIAAGIQGTFEGGYRAALSGSLLASPTWPTRGSVGVTDHQCSWTDSNNDGVFNYGEESCPGVLNWTEQYFSGSSFSYEWWGWIYHGGSNGTWVNACSGPDPDCPGNSGDITD